MRIALHYRLVNDSLLATCPYAQFCSKARCNIECGHAAFEGPLRQSPVGLSPEGIETIVPWLRDRNCTTNAYNCHTMNLGGK